MKTASVGQVTMLWVACLLLVPTLEVMYAAPVVVRGTCDCGVLKNRVADVEQTIDLHQTNHDRLAGTLISQQKKLDKIVMDQQGRGQFVDSMLERTSEDVFYLGEKYESLYKDVDILSNLTQTTEYKMEKVNDKVKSYATQASYLQQEIDQIRSYLVNIQARYQAMVPSGDSEMSANDVRTFPKLMRKVKEIKRKSESMGRILNNARGQTWAMQKNLRSIQTHQGKLRREIGSLRQMTRDNMDIIKNQFLNIQANIDKKMVQFNRTIQGRLKTMKEEIFNEVMSTTVEMLVLKPAKYILEQGWYPQVHHKNWDKD